MRNFDLQKAFKATLFDLKLSAVKQFAAAILLLGMALPASSAPIPYSCSQIHTPGTKLSHLDSTVFERTWYSFLRKYSNFTPTDPEGNPIKVKVHPRIKMATDPKKMLDSAFMGVLGRIFDLKYDPNQKKTVVAKNEFVFPEEMSRVADLLPRAMKHPLSDSFQKLIRANLRMEELTDQSTLIQLKNFEDAKNPRPQDEVSNAIRSRFMTMYLQMVNWVYRLSNLEKNKGLSSAVMMDETVQLFKEGKTFHFHLLFDREVLDVQLHILQHWIELYEMEKEPKAKQEILDRISQPEDPFLPFSGVVASVSFLDPQAPVELKRYFKNDLEDPLGLIQPKEKNDFVQRHLMLAKTIEMLPGKTVLEIHAHSLVHARAYLKLGFKKESIIENPKYPGVQVHLLKGVREEVLEKIKLILNKSESEL